MLDCMVAYSLPKPCLWCTYLPCWFVWWPIAYYNLACGVHVSHHNMHVQIHFSLRHVIVCSHVGMAESPQSVVTDPFHHHRTLPTRPRVGKLPPQDPPLMGNRTLQRREGARVRNSRRRSEPRLRRRPRAHDHHLLASQNRAEGKSPEKLPP